MKQRLLNLFALALIGLGAADFLRAQVTPIQTQACCGVCCGNCCGTNKDGTCWAADSCPKPK